MLSSGLCSMNSSDLCQPWTTKEVIKFGNVPGVCGGGAAEPSSWAKPATRPNKGVQAARLYESSECSVQKWDSVFREISCYPTPVELQRQCLCGHPFRRAAAGRGGLALGAFPGRVGKGLSLQGLVTCD